MAGKAASLGFDMVFNELSLEPVATDVGTARQRMDVFRQTIMSAKRVGMNDCQSEEGGRRVDARSRLPICQVAE